MARKFLGVAASLLSNWVTRADIAPVRNPQSSAYSVQASDLGKLIECTGTWTLGTLAAATAGAGFYFSVKKTDNTGVITIDPNSSETIEGLTSIKLYGGECGYKIWTDSTAWYAIGRQHGWIDTTGVVSVSSGTASVSITTPFSDPEGRDVDIDILDYVPSGTSVLNFVATQSSAATPSGEFLIGSTTTVTSGAQSASPIALSASSTNVASSYIQLRNVLATAASNIRVFAFSIQSASMRIAGANYSTAGALTAVSLTPSAGTITSMQYSVKVLRP